MAKNRPTLVKMRVRTGKKLKMVLEAAGICIMITSLLPATSINEENNYISPMEINTPCENNIA